MIQSYINKLIDEFKTGYALEHSYRPAIKSLIESLNPTIIAVNEPSRSAHGAPDLAFYKKKNNNIVLGYVETKDINVNLDQIEKSEQLKRYLGYANLILTNYLEFRFFRNGEKYQSINIAIREGSGISSLEENFSLLELELQSFLEGKPETITNGKRLSEIMGGKAARIKANVINYLNNKNDRNQELIRIYKVMQKLLIHDLEINNFADMYAQTLVYGLFVARYYDSTPDSFSRQEARDLIPASNPFLQHFFDHIAGSNFDKRLSYIVDELCEVFSVSDIQSIIQKHYNLFGETTDKDPIIHFYEDFLKEYDPELRKQMGAYYTPVPVVNFIIKSVDYILKNEFKLHDGLADNSKVVLNIMQQGTKAKLSLHKVQILDPAVGTATFLNESIKFIFSKFKGQEGLWKSYVEKELLPRIYGFELMMAPYTIAHLKLAMTLKETGIDTFDRRLGVYLTNTLEEGIKAEETLFGIGFGQTIAEESEEATNIKNNKPIMVIMGNPPYSVSSSNKGQWISDLISVYKEDLNERNIQPLSDDYIKFIRFSEYFIEKNKTGVVAMITNNSFLDGLIHRQMRKHLLKTFDEIYVLDLHGNSKKKEKTPEGEKDENVFDIQQGVAITIFIRATDKKKKLGTLHHAQLFGLRNNKFQYLEHNDLLSIKWKKLKYSEPYYFFVPKNFNVKNEYENGFKLDEFFQIFSSGVTTFKDDLIISFNEQELEIKKHDLQVLNEEQIRMKYHFKDTRDLKLKNIISDLPKSTNVDILYRPFDIRKIIYSKKTKGVVAYPRYEVMKNMLVNENIGIQLSRQQSTYNFQHALVSNKIADRNSISMQTREATYFFPLYIYDGFIDKSPNIKNEIVKKIEVVIGKISYEEIFDYIYCILYSQRYRNKYKEFLKIDFPRIPYPIDKNTFKILSTLGEKLRKLHLMEDQDINKKITSYPISGENLVEKLDYRDNRVFINDLQFFGDVPNEAWDFYIGGYQPAQKWLKDRKGRILNYEEINHYQNIIASLDKTIKIMTEIDKITM